MPNVTSPLGTSQRYIPALNAGQLGRWPGLVMVFADAAALASAVADERLNITDTSPLWANDQPLGLMAEVGQGVTRAWSTAQQHARTAILRQGVRLVLGADTSVVLFGTGAPAGGLGANGDAYLNTATGDYYSKASGAWTLQGTIAIRAAARTASLAYAATVTVNADTTDAATIAPAAGSLLINVSGTPGDHQTVRIYVRQDGTGGRSIALGTMFALPADVAAVPWDTGANRGTLVVATYLAAKAKWVVMSAMPGI